MKYLRVIFSIFFITLILGSLIYNSFIAPDDSTSVIGRLAKLTFPLFMLGSFLMLYLKKREDTKDKKKISDEDRKNFSSVGNPDDY